MSFTPQTKKNKSPDGLPVAPSKYVRPLAHMAHQSSHMSKGGMATQILKSWYAPRVHEEAARITRDCIICRHYNLARAKETKQSARPESA